MELTAENRLRKLIVVGDRLLIRPKKQPDKTDSGLYLPPGVQEKEKVQTGFVIKVGPGYPIPMATDEDEPWKSRRGTSFQNSTVTFFYWSRLINLKSLSRYTFNCYHVRARVFFKCEVS